jgi:hypothetical protein
LFILIPAFSKANLAQLMPSKRERTFSPFWVFVSIIFIFSNKYSPCQEKLFFGVEKIKQKSQSPTNREMQREKKLKKPGVGHYFLVHSQCTN